MAVSLLTKDNQKAEFQKKLLAWYQENKRVMPWRDSKNPYYIWVSEIMLQQTRVETVIPYFNRFVKELPTIEALASVDEQQLLKLWEGLGYYSRVKNMKVAANDMIVNHNGQLYDNKKELMTLKGIGPYSAGAIASIAFNERVSAVDGNVLRIVARLLNRKDNILEEKTKKAFTAIIEELLPEEGIGDFNQALMELGALLCVPGNPDCNNCPVSSFCQAKKNENEKNLPTRIKKMTRKKAKMTVLLIEHQEKYALLQRKEEALLKGLYEFPNEKGFLTKKEVMDICRSYGFLPEKITKIKEASATFTHIKWEMQGYYIKVKNTCEPFVFATKEEIIDQYPVASAFKSFLEQLS